MERIVLSSFWVNCVEGDVCVWSSESDGGTPRSYSRGVCLQYGQVRGGICLFMVMVEVRVVGWRSTVATERGREGD